MFEFFFKNTVWFQMNKYLRSISHIENVLYNLMPIIALLTPSIVLFSFCVWDYMSGIDLRSLTPRWRSTGQPFYSEKFTDACCKFCS